MSAVPEEFVAAAADEVFVQPAVGPGRDAVAQGFFGAAAQFAAAAHAARTADREAELAEHQRELLWNAQRRRQPEHGNDSVAQEPALHEHGVRGQDSGLSLPRLAQQFVIRYVRLPGGIVARRSQPPGEPAQTSIAQEQDRHWLGSGLLEWLAGGELLIDLRQGVGRGHPVAHAQAPGPGDQPLHALLHPSRPGASQQRAEPVLVASPDAAHLHSLAAKGTRECKNLRQYSRVFWAGRGRNSL